MQTTSVKKIDNKHIEWKKSLGFYKDELIILNKRLTEIAERNTGKDVMQMVERFQNQFLVQSENIDILQHDINEHITAIAQESLYNAGHINKNQVDTHQVLQERVEQQEIIFNDIKDDFMKFLCKRM